MAVAIWLQPPEAHRLGPALQWLFQRTCLGSWLGALPTLSPRVGPLELSAMELREASSIAKQLAFEMNIRSRGRNEGTKEQQELMLRAIWGLWVRLGLAAATTAKEKFYVA